MSELKYTPQEYLTEMIMSDSLVLLLEGTDDRKFFTELYTLLEEHYKKYSPEKVNLLQKIRIETVEEIKGEPENRAKVEQVCRLALTPEYQTMSQKILGFVDREFREFSFSSDLLDKLEKHNIEGRIIWSRGHSIENYFFDLQICQKTFKTLYTSQYSNQASNLFGEHFEATIRMACALSLAAWKQGLLKLIVDTDWTFIEIEQNSITMNIEEWKAVLEKKNLDSDRINRLMNEFNEYHNGFQNADFVLLRWLCHGHIGFNFIFAVYKKCFEKVINLSNNSKISQEYKQVDDYKKMRFTICAKEWANFFRINGSNEFPLRCLLVLIEEENISFCP